MSKICSGTFALPPALSASPKPPWGHHDQPQTLEMQAALTLIPLQQLLLSPPAALGAAGKGFYGIAAGELSSSLGDKAE